MKGMKRTILVSTVLFAFATGASAQTGNLSDFESFQANWKKSHNLTTELTPAQYEQMKIEWVSLNATETAEKKPLELSTAEKIKLKQEHKNQEQGLPADFPMKVNTGNSDADEAAYQQAKAAWIANNPEKYKQMTIASKESATQREAIRQQELTNQNQ